MNLPNKITISRICLIPLVLFFFLADFIPYGKLVAALIFGIAAITDNIDGRIARKRNMVTDLGKFLDPIADKVLVTSGLLLIIAYPIVGEGISQPLPIVLPVWAGVLCASLMLARELIISAFRQIAATKNLVLAADKSGKIKAFFQDITIFLYMIFAFMVQEFYPTIQGVPYTVINIVLLVLLAVSTILTITSGINYVVKNKSVLKNGDSKPEEIMRYDMIIPAVLREFIQEGIVSEAKISERFNVNRKRANKIIKDMIDLGYISNEKESNEHEILMTEEDFKETFED